MLHVTVILCKLHGKGLCTDMSLEDSLWYFCEVKQRVQNDTFLAVQERRRVKYYAWKQWLYENDGLGQGSWEEGVPCF